jgi:hypothetical protein
VYSRRVLKTRPNDLIKLNRPAHDQKKVEPKLHLMLFAGKGRGLLQQRQHALGHLVGLGQHRSTRLLQYLGPGHIGHFHRIVGIFDP